MILDATAGNRAIYQTKHSDNIVYVDIEKKLERKLTVFADNNHLPFRRGVFSTVFYDPPYYWGSDNPWYMIPDSKTYFERFGEKRKAPRYYGVDKFKSKSKLINSVYHGLKEVRRILTPDGVLWLKWCEVKITLNQILSLFEDYDKLLRIQVSDNLQTHSSCQTYWISFTKNGYETVTLDDYGNEKN